MTREQLLDLEDQRCLAMLRPDINALVRLLHADLVYTHSTAVVDGRTDLVGKIQSGTLRYVTISREISSVFALPFFGFVHHRLTMDVEVAGALRTVKSQALSVWTGLDGLYQMVAFHSTPEL